MGEACDLGHDPVSGARITRLTSAVMTNVNIYCEQPYTSSDGRRIAVIRSPEADPRVPPFDLCVVDLETLALTCVARQCTSYMVGTAAWSGAIYYLTQRRELARLSLDTMESEVVWADWDMPVRFGLDSVSPDERYLIGVRQTPDFTSQVVRVDLREKRSEVIFTHREQLGHMQFNPVHGRDIMIQLNRGAQIDDAGRVRSVETVLPGATHFLIDRDGGNLRELPIGEPYTSGTCGHSAWVADTGRVAISVSWRPPYTGPGPLDERYPQGNLLTAAPGEDAPRVFEAREHRFNHIGVSRCGRYFVADSYWKGVPGPIPIVIGNLESGRYAAAVTDCGASCGASAGGHPHAYLTADNRNVIYNADPYHVPHVHRAELPDGFLEGLE